MHSSHATPSHPGARHHPLLRHRDGHHARVTFEELFFDLVYVFAVTQLSHQLLHHLTVGGVVEVLILWFAVWLGWQYTCWVTNWFDPETPQIRGLIFANMLLGLVMASSIPQAFGERGMVFALSYVAIQVGRTAFIAFQLPSGHALAANYRRMLVWLLVSAAFWIAGALAEHGTRAALWSIAVVCEYGAPMVGFAVPGMGRSNTRDWTIEGGHLAERCQLFVIVALGETLLATGATLSDVEHWSSEVLQALVATFLGTLAMWWLYFGTSSKDASEAIVRSADPGRIGPTSTMSTRSWWPASSPQPSATTWCWPIRMPCRAQRRSPFCCLGRRSTCWAARSTSRWCMAAWLSRTSPAPPCCWRSCPSAWPATCCSWGG